MAEVNKGWKTKGIEGMIKRMGYEIEGVGKMEDPHIT